MTIKKELKKIVSALGGTSTANTIPGVIGEIADNTSGGGGTSSVFITSMTLDSVAGTYTLGNTWQEIYDAMDDGKVCIAKSGDELLVMNWFIAECYGDESESYYRVTLIGLGSDKELTAESKNGYPSGNVE